VPRVLAILAALLPALHAAGAWAGAPEQADTIRLRSTAVLDEGATPTLADVADLSGPIARSLAGVTLAGIAPADASGWRRIDAQSVRRAIDAAHDDTPWGAIQLRGGPCHARTAQPASEPDASGREASRPPDAPARAGTVRALAERWIATRLRAHPRDVRVRWVEGDADLLDRQAGDLLAHFEDAGQSDRLALRITLYRPDASVAGSGRARAEVSVRRLVAVMARDRRRRDVLEPPDVTRTPRWLPAAQTPADPDEVVGLELAESLDGGAVVLDRHVRSAVVVDRGDRLRVRVVTPTVTATVLARALGEARVGEVISLETLEPSRRDRIRFEARIASAGEAVAVAGVRP